MSPSGLASLPRGDEMANPKRWTRPRNKHGGFRRGDALETVLQRAHATERQRQENGAFAFLYRVSRRRRPVRRGRLGKVSGSKTKISTDLHVCILSPFSTSLFLVDMLYCRFLLETLVYPSQFLQKGRLPPCAFLLP